MLSRSGISVAKTQLTTSWPCWVAALSEPKLSQLINCSWWLGSAQGVNFKSMSWVLLPFLKKKKTKSTIPYWSSNLSKLMPVTVVVIIGTIPTITPLPLSDLTISDPHGCRICPPSPGLLLPLWSGHWVINISIIMVACALQWMCLKVCAWEIVWQSAGLIR